MKAKIFYSTIKTLCLLFVSTTTLSGCANIPRYVIIAPSIDRTPAVSYANKQAQLHITDMRTASHIVQIMREGKAATLVGAKESLADTITKHLTKHWQKQRLLVAENAGNTINISIEKALVSVEQSFIKYKAQTEIVLKVVINNGSQTSTTIFTNRGSSNGPLQADIAVLERHFNQGLTNLLTQILTSKKISTPLK